MSNNLNNGHRDRVKNRFISDGLENFAPHNILEILLFYSIPRKDTNKIAHNLIKHFGSLSNVIDAEYEELVKIDGITKNTATLIKLIPAISSHYLKEKASVDGILNTVEKMGEFLKPFYIGKTTECVYCIAFDSKLKTIKCELMFEGSVNAVSITNRKVVEFAAINKASIVVLSHNHPNGVAIPSQADIKTTVRLKDALALIEVVLLDHIIVVDDDFVSMRDSKII